MEQREEIMKEVFQRIIDDTEDLMDAIGKMDWDRIEVLGTDITDRAQTLKILSQVS